MLTIQVIIAGLVAIVPRPDLGVATLLFVDSLQEKGSVQAHVPFIESLGAVSCAGQCGFPLTIEDLDDSTPLGMKTAELLEDGEFPLPENDPDFFYWIPVGRSVRVVPPSGSFKFPLNFLGSEFQAGPYPKSQAEVSSWRWILPMDSLAPGSGVINDLCLRSPAKCAVGASLEVPLGSIGNCLLLNGADDKVTTFKLKALGQESVQAISSFGLLQFSVPEDFIQLESGCLDDGCHHKDALLRPEKGSHAVTLIVGGVPFPEMKGKYGHHLEYFRSLARNIPAAGMMAVPEDTGNLFDLDPFSSECDEPDDLHELEGIASLNPALVIFVAFQNKPECGPVVLRN